MGCLDHPRITGISLEGIEMDQVSARSIEHETQDLFEDPGHRLSFHALSHPTEQTLKVRIQQDLLKIADKETQPSAGAQSIRCLLNLHFAGDEWEYG